uniref:Sorting nexin-20 n=1 Tax=Callorhinchus milii TaxID=7868 RepID=V9KTH2_CALMI
MEDNKQYQDPSEPKKPGLSETLCNVKLNDEVSTTGTDSAAHTAQGTMEQAALDTTPAYHSPPVPETLLTTKQLLQYWTAVNKRVKPIRLLFDIPETRTVESQCSKYVMYKVVVIRSGTYDGNQASIERRYSDFERLHKNIVKNFKEEVEEIAFPKKIVSGNFTEEKITERKLAFIDYLGKLYAIKDIRNAEEFTDFFFLSEVREGYTCLRGGQYTRALDILLNVLSLQEKLYSTDSQRLVPTLSAISVCCKDLGNMENAYRFSEKAGIILQNYSHHKYLIPLLKTQISLGYSLDKDIRQVGQKVADMEELQGQSNMVSLKELVVQEYV